MTVRPKPIVVVADPRLMPMVEPLRGEFIFVALDNPEAEQRSAEVEAILFVGSNKVDAQVLDRFPNCRLAVAPSTGIDGLDLAAAQSRGIVVTNDGGIFASDVAAYGAALVLAARGGLCFGDRFVREGQWGQAQPKARRSIGADRVGIVGLGRIGGIVAQCLAPLCAEVGWHSPRPKPSPWRYFADLPELAGWSDILVVCARGEPETTGMIDAAILDAIGPQGLLVNIARGFMVDEDALIAALQDGRLGGAALDVFRDEPSPAARWRGVPNVLLSPHTGGLTRESFVGRAEIVRHNLRTLLTGEPLLHLIKIPK